MMILWISMESTNGISNNKKKGKNEKFKFLDLTDTLKGDRFSTYIDFCHIDAG